MSRKVIAPVLWLAFLVLAGQTSEYQSLNMEQLEDNLFSLVNHERSLRGLHELQFDPRLRTMAREHSKQMILENRLSHDFPGYDKLGARAVKAGLRFSIIAENLAVGDTVVMRNYLEQMLASPGHCANLLDKDFTHLGIGIEKAGRKYYITQEFAGRYKP
jgi:uncharacterized protein YkwD